MATKYKTPKESRERQSKAIKQWLSEHPEHKKKMSKGMKKFWDDIKKRAKEE